MSLLPAFKGTIDTILAEPNVKLRLWLSGDANVYDDSSGGGASPPDDFGVVKEWRNFEPFADNAEKFVSAGDPADYPLYNPEALNSSGSVRFQMNGAVDGARNMTPSGSLANFTGSATYVFSLNVYQTAASRELFTPNSAFTVLVANASDKLGVIDGGAGTQSFLDNTGAPIGARDKAQVLIVRCIPASSQILCDYSRKGLDAVKTQIPATLSDYGIGTGCRLGAADAAGADGYRGDMVEVLGFEGVLRDEQVAALLFQLKRNIGL